jgi:hypothetical protein
MENTIVRANSLKALKANNLGFEHIGWKYYRKIKKKAMEQEFSWSGLLLSLSIAFFIVIFTALALNFFYQSLEKAREQSRFWKKEIYQLEKMENLKTESSRYWA